MDNEELAEASSLIADVNNQNYNKLCEHFCCPGHFLQAMGAQFAAQFMNLAQGYGVSAEGALYLLLEGVETMNNQREEAESGNKAHRRLDS